MHSTMLSALCTQMPARSWVGHSPREAGALSEIGACGLWSWQGFSSSPMGSPLNT